MRPIGVGVVTIGLCGGARGAHRHDGRVLWRRLCRGVHINYVEIFDIFARKFDELVNFVALGEMHFHIPIFCSKTADGFQGDRLLLRIHCVQSALISNATIRDQGDVRSNEGCLSCFAHLKSNFSSCTQQSIVTFTRFGMCRPLIPLQAT